MHRCFVPLALLVTLPGCVLGARETPPTSPPGDARPASLVGTPPTTGTTGVPELPGTTPSAAPSTAPVPPDPAFRAIVEAPSDARLHALEGALLLARETAQDENGNPIGVVRGDTIVYPKELHLEGWFHQVVTIQGRYPDDVHLLSVGDTGRTGIAEHYRLDPKRGWRGKDGQVGSWYVGMARFGKSLLGLASPVMWGSSDLVTLSGPRATPKLTDAKQCPPGEEWQARGTQTRIIAAALISTTGGELLAFGNDCTGGASFEIWQPGAVRSTVLPLPSGEQVNLDGPEAVVLLAGGDDDAWLLPDGERLYHYRDGAVTTVALPKGASACHRAAVAQGGALWVACAGRAFERLGETWEARLTPGDVPVDDLAASDGTVWALGGGWLLKASAKSAADTASVATTAAGPPTPPPAVTPQQTKAQARKRLPRLGSPSCATNLVILYGFTKTTPPDYDFPLTRKALRGHPEFEGVRFVVTRDVGQRFFSAMVPSFAVGKDLKALIQRELAGSKPQIVCAEPEIEREVTMDLSQEPKSAATR